MRTTPRARHRARPRRARRPSAVASDGSPSQPTCSVTRHSACHWVSSATEMATQRSCTPWASTSAVRYTPCGTLVALRLPRRSSSRPYAECSTICSAARLSDGTDHRALDVHPPTGAPPVLEREEERDGGVRTAHRVGDARGRLRAPVREAADPGDPGLRLDGRRVGEPLPPRAGDAVRRCAQHDQLRVPRQEDLLVEVELLEHAWAEVVEHDVAARDELEEQLASAFGVELDGDVELVGVRAVEHRAPLPPLRLAHRSRGVEPDAVGTLRRLDVDHLRPEDAARVPDDRPGPERGEVDDANAGERQRRRGGAATPRSTSSGAVVPMVAGRAR